MKGMHDLQDTGKFYVPQMTGPGTTKRAFLSFMSWDGTDAMYSKYAKPKAGHYIGAVDGNRSVDVYGTTSNNNDWCIRSAINGRKKVQGFKAMNISGYQELNKVENNQTCVMKLFDKYV
ncbi:MAG: hypothetical protein SGARI_005051, partial [Bacillariaceae sp.]